MLWFLERYVFLGGINAERGSTQFGTFPNIRGNLQGRLSLNNPCRWSTATPHRWQWSIVGSTSACGGTFCSVAARGSLITARQWIGTREGLGMRSGQRWRRQGWDWTIFNLALEYQEGILPPKILLSVFSKKKGGLMWRSWMPKGGVDWFGPPWSKIDIGRHNRTVCLCLYFYFCFCILCLFVSHWVYWWGPSMVPDWYWAPQSNWRLKSVAVVLAVRCSRSRGFSLHQRV